jgi:cytochrome c-type biogenesis protein CcmH
MHRVTLLLLTLLLAPPTLAGQRYSAEIETEATKIFNSTMSPFCPGRTIATCPSPQAAELKDQVRAELAAGVSPDSVKEQLYAAYGEEVRAVPRASGFGLLAWVLPGLVLLVGGLVVLYRLRAGAGLTRAAPTAADDVSLEPDEQARLERELAQL